MTDSRAALEERWLKFFEAAMAKQFVSTMATTSEIVADFYEQESSSLKLLLSAMLAEKWDFCRIDEHSAVLWINDTEFPVELDSSGIPVLTPEILEALEAAK